MTCSLLIPGGCGGKSLSTSEAADSRTVWQSTNCASGIARNEPTLLRTDPFLLHHRPFAKYKVKRKIRRVSERKRATALNQRGGYHRTLPLLEGEGRSMYVHGHSPIMTIARPTQSGQGRPHERRYPYLPAERHGQTKKRAQHRTRESPGKRCAWA